MPGSKFPLKSSFLTGTHVPNSITAMDTAAVVHTMINTASSILWEGRQYTLVPHVRITKLYIVIANTLYSV